MKKIVIFTSSSLRHKAFVKIIQDSKQFFISNVFYEKSNFKKIVEEKENNNLQKQHLLARDQSEIDFFGLFVEDFNNDFCIENVDRGWFSTDDCLRRIKKIKPDLILVYGTSIIKGDIITSYNKKILNLHLGLSPYYRGSGTNYFPFVNGEPEYCGATFMFLNDGIDTGNIIHQIRPEIYRLDSFHQLSNRFLIYAFKTYKKIVENIHKFKEFKIQTNLQNNNYKLFLRKDFTEDSVKNLYKNFSDKMLEKYISNKKYRDSKVPIFEQKFELK